MGRFAPTPSGDLHLGSLYTAAASYLDARAQGGRWLLRIEDVDAARAVPNASARIVATLERFGFEWDGVIKIQSARIEHYRAAVQKLRDRGLTFECTCSRSQLEDEQRYPGTCRELSRQPSTQTGTRLRVEPGMIGFVDEIQGAFRQNVAAAAGDLTIKRRDQVFAYLLAVVLDDAEQGVSHVVRGADLLDNTPRQIHLQRSLEVRTPRYSHVPVLTEIDGTKLAKSRRSVGIDGAAAPLLDSVFRLLGMTPPTALLGAPPREMWEWGVAHWDKNNVPKCLNLRVTC